MSSWLKKMGGSSALAALPAELGAAEVLVDCSYPGLHAGEHRAHPVTGRLVCPICHGSGKQR